MKASNILLDGFIDKDSFESSNVRKSLFYYLRYWKLFLLSFTLVALLLFIYIYYTIPVYQVSSTIMLKDELKGAVFVQNPILSELNEFKSSQITDNEIDVLQSSDLMQEVISELGISNLYYFENDYGKQEPVLESNLPFLIEVLELDRNKEGGVLFTITKIQEEQIIFSEDGLEQTARFEEVAQSGNTVFRFRKNEDSVVHSKFPIIARLITGDQLASMMSSGLKVETKDKNSSVLYLTLDTQFPELGVEVLDELVHSYNRDAVLEKKEVATNSLKFLDEQLEVLSKDLGGVQSNIENFKNNRQVVDIENDYKFYQQNAMDDSKQVTIYRNELEIMESLNSELLDNSQKNITLGQVSNNDPALLTMMENFNQEVENLQRLNASILPENPVYINSQKRISSIRNKILGHLNDRISALKISIRNTEAASSTLSDKYQSGPRIQRQYEVLTRDLDFKKEHYLDLIKKREETTLYLASVPDTHSKTIERASFSPYQVSPNKPLLFLISLFAAFAIPFSYLFLKRSFQNKLEDRSQLSELMAATVLGEITQIDKKVKGLIINQNSKTPFSEQLRYVRTSFCLDARGKDSKVVLVTSTISGEGKTFFALNFAKSMSMIGKKTALLFYDLRKPFEYNDLFKIDRIGISDYLANKSISTKQIINSGISYEGVTFFPSGKPPVNPAELLLDPRNQLLIQELEKHFDFIVIDSAPVGQVSDAFSLIPLVDSTIYMMRYNWTSNQEIEFFQRLTNEGKLDKPLLVLNGSRVGQGYSYGYYQYS